MPRRRLTDEERAERKRAANERGFKQASFRQYDPNDGVGYGNARQWRGAAGAAIGGEGFTMENSGPAKTRRRNADLELLGLAELTTLAALTKAYRGKAKQTHSDTGGSDAAFIAVKAAFDRLKERLPQ